MTGRNAEFGYAKRRETTCAYARGVDGLNGPQPALAGSRTTRPAPDGCSGDVPKRIQASAAGAPSADLFDALIEWLSPFPVDARAADPCGEHREVLRVEKLSLDFYDYLALCAPLFDVGKGFRGRLEWKDPVYNGTNSTGIDERTKLA